MTKREQIISEIDALYEEGTKLATALQDDKAKQFQYDYQSWYSKALKVVSTMAPDRASEFRAYYEIDPKRKSLGYGTWVIQDFVKNVIPNRHNHPEFNSRNQAVLCFFNQLTILKAISDRSASVLSDIETELYSHLQDNELVVARQLLKISCRAAGALVGVVIEGHLQKVAANHSVTIAKKHPTIADLNDPLKSAGVIDTPTWRKLSYLADLRNLCSHKKDSDPSKEQVEELISGAEWLVKNVL